MKSIFPSLPPPDTFFCSCCLEISWCGSLVWIYFYSLCRSLDCLVNFLCFETLIFQFWLLLMKVVFFIMSFVIPPSSFLSSTSSLPPQNSYCLDIGPPELFPRYFCSLFLPFCLLCHFLNFEAFFAFCFAIIFFKLPKVLFCCFLNTSF